MDKLGLNLGYFLFQVFNFTILVILLYAWAYKPIVKALEARKKKIAQGLEDARVAAEARANAEKEAAEIMRKAQTEAGEEAQKIIERAEAAELEIRTSAEAEAQKEREAVLVEAQQERDRILGDVRGQVAALAIAATQKLIGESLDEKRQRDLINELFSGIKAGKVTVLEGVTFSGATADVVSALPLTPDEQETVRRDIFTRMGSQATVNFRVDPSILGGLVIRAGGKVLDASVAGQLESLRQSLV